MEIQSKKSLKSFPEWVPLTGCRKICCLIGIACCLSYDSRLLPAQDSGTPGRSESTRAADDSPQSEDADWALEQIHRLNHQSYRARQAARSLLEENPLQSLQVIPVMIRQVDSVIGLQLVEILSGLALHSDIRVSDVATGILRSLAGDANAIGRAASNSMSAISDLQEEKAIQVLTTQNAYIGPQNFSINGRLDRGAGGPLSLRIDDQFWGTDEDFEWIRYLKSIQVVYLRGEKISPRAIEAVSQLKNLRAVRLRSVSLTKEQLLLFQNLEALEHLGLSYMDVDDSYVPSIAQLNISHSIRLYGTQVSEAGEQQLAKQFLGLEIFRGSGGFLGITSISRRAQVEQVTANSAASNAGIRQGDVIIGINDVPVETFDQLRVELGKYRVHETVKILLLRDVYDRLHNEIQTIEMTVMATLLEENS